MRIKKYSKSICINFVTVLDKFENWLKTLKFDVTARLAGSFAAKFIYL